MVVLLEDNECLVARKWHNVGGYIFVLNIETPSGHEHYTLYLHILESTMHKRVPGSSSMFHLLGENDKL